MERNSDASINKRKLYESAILQVKLESAGRELIYIDEFSLNSKYNSYYGWTKRGGQGYIKINYDNFLCILYLLSPQNTSMVSKGYRDK